MVLKHDGKLVEIGLHGISCPKWGQPFALEAAQFTENMVKGIPLEVTPAKGKHAAVSVDGKSLNEALVKTGLAWWQQPSAQTT